MNKSLLVKNIVDDFLTKKEGKSILKNIEKKNLVNDGILDSLDILTVASEIEKKKKKLIFLNQRISKNLINTKI